MIRAAVRRHRAVRTNRSVRSRAGRDRVSVDREAGADRMIGSHVRECVTRDRANGNAIDEHVGNVIAISGCNRERLAAARIDVHIS